MSREGKRGKEPSRCDAGSVLSCEMRLVQALAISLQVPDDLRNRGDQLTHDLIDVLRRQLPLTLEATERSLEG